MAMLPPYAHGHGDRSGGLADEDAGLIGFDPDRLDRLDS
jgi:hypothetical protein